MSDGDWLRHPFTRIAAGLLFLFFFPPLAIRASPDFGKEREPRDHAAPYQRDSEAAPDPALALVEAPADPGSDVSAAQASENAGSQAPKQFNWLQDTLAQWGMLGVSLVALGFSFWAVKLLGRTLSLQRKTSEVELRPYVHMFDIQTARLVVDASLVRTRETYRLPVQYQITVRWKNTGATPARGLVIMLNFAVLDHELPVGFTFPDRLPVEGASVAPLGSDDTRSLTVEPRPFDEAIRAWRGQTHIYCWGWAEYSDDLPNTPRYRSECAFKVICSGDPRLDGVRFNPEILDRHNGMDGECMNPPRTK